MSKQTRGKKNSWRGKAMAALALSAVFGLSTGAALAATTDVEDAGDLLTTIEGAEDIYNIIGQIDAGNTAMSAGQLNIGGKLIIGGPAGAAGDLAFADGTKLTFTGGLIKAKEIVFGQAAGDTLNLSDATKAIGIYIGGSAPAPASDDGPVGVISADKLTYNPSGSAWQPKNTIIYLADGGTFTMTPDNAANPLGGHPMNTETLAEISRASPAYMNMPPFTATLIKVTGSRSTAAP